MQKEVYILAVSENTDCGDPTLPQVRVFGDIKTAQDAMKASFDAKNAILRFPTTTEDEDGEHYTSKSEDGIYVVDGMDSYRWDIETQTVDLPDTLEVKTPKGTLRAEAPNLPDYPEIFLMATGPDASKPERQVAVLQFTPDGKFKLLVWDDDNSDDNVKEFIISQDYVEEV